MTFSEKLKRAHAGAPAWARPLPAQLRAMGKTLSVDEVHDALAELDELARFREKLSQDPESNCDDTDDVHFAQHDVAIALRQCSSGAADALATGLRSAHTGTRFWVAWSLQSAGTRRCISVIERALDAEDDELTRKALATALENARSLSRGPLGLLQRRIRAKAASDA